MMNRKTMLSVIILCALSITVSCEQIEQVSQDGFDQEYKNYQNMPVRTIAKEIINKIKTGEYKYVGDFIDYLADKKIYSIDGTRILEDLYDYIGEKKGYEESLDKWCSMENPHYSAFLIRGRFHMKDAWLARGKEYGYAVSDEDMSLFKERLMLAKADLEKAYSMNPKDPNSASSMITVCQGLSLDEDIMEEWFKKAVKADPISFGAYQRKLTYLAPRWHGTEKKQLKFAKYCYRKAPSKSIIRANMIYYMTDSCKKSKYREYFVKPSVKKMLDKIYSDTLKMFPKTLTLRKEYAYIQRETGDYQGSIKTLNEALEFDPGDPILLLARGDVYFEMLKDYQTAEPDYYRSIESDPDIPLTYFQLGQMYKDYYRDYKKANEYYNKAISLYPKEKQYYTSRGYNTIMMERNFLSALEDFNKAEKLDYLFFWSNFYKAMCLHELERFEEAEEYYEKSLDILNDEQEEGTSELNGNKITNLITICKDHLQSCKKKESLYGQKKAANKS